MAYFSFTIGMQCAAYSLVGKAIGAQNIRMAKRYRDIIIISGIILAFLQSTTIVFFKADIAVFFTNVESIQSVLIPAFNAAAIALFFECIQLAIQGIFRGIGKQKYAFYLIVFSFYFIGLPLSYTIGIYWGYGLTGLWYGISIGLVILTAAYIYLSLYHFNWQVIALEA